MRRLDLRTPRGRRATRPTTRQNDRERGGDDSQLGVFVRAADPKLDLDRELSPAQRAEAAAWLALVEDRLHVALLYDWWYEDARFGDVGREAYNQNLGWPLRAYMPTVIRCATWLRDWLARRRSATATRSLPPAPSRAVARLAD